MGKGVGEKVYQCSELVKLFNTGHGKVRRKTPKQKKKQEKIKHDQTEAATKQIYVFGQKKKKRVSGKSERKCVQKGSVLRSLES